MLCNAFSRPCEISRSPIDSSSDWPQVCTILIIIIANNAIIGAEEREAREAPLTLPPALIRQCTKCGRRWHLSWRLGWLLRLGIKIMANCTTIVHFSALFYCIIYKFYLLSICLNKRKFHVLFIMKASSHCQIM